MSSSEGYQISSLKIENFRQYRDADIKFSRDPKKAFTVLRGSNGAGKTNIMNAITWCLYGTEHHVGSSEKELPIVNIKALKEKPEGIVRMRVVVKLADSGGDQISIERELCLLTQKSNTDVNIIVDKQTGVLIPENSTPLIKTMYRWYDPSMGGWQNTEYFDKKVKELLPEDLATYFLFDGEKLEEFFKYNENAEKGIKDVSQINVVAQVIETLGKFISQKMKNVKSLNPEIKRYQNMVNEQEKELRGISNKIKKIKGDIRTKEDRGREIEQARARSGGDVEEYQERLSSIKREISDLQKDHDGIKSDRKKYVLEHMLDVHLLSTINETIESIARKGEEGVLPPEIQDTFLRELLEKGKCICGSDISAGHPSREKVIQLSKKAQYSGISGICLDLNYALKPILDVEKTRAELIRWGSDMLASESKIRTKQDERANLEVKIGDVDDEQIRALNKEEKTLDGVISKLNENLGYNKKAEEDKGKQLQIYSRALERELRTDIQHEYLTRQLDFCKTALSPLEKIKTKLLDDTRETVRCYTKQYFLEFLWKKGTYDDVIIDEKYQIAAHHVEGYNVRAALSKGEKLVLALSFMAALRKITGFGFPLLIDTPLGRVSGEPRHNIARTLPDFLKNNQVTLLVTDSEYQTPIEDDKKKQVFPSVRSIMNTYVGADYDIVFTDDESKVQIHE